MLFDREFKDNAVKYKFSAEKYLGTCARIRNRAILVISIAQEVLGERGLKFSRKRHPISQ